MKKVLVSLSYLLSLVNEVKVKIRLKQPKIPEEDDLSEI